MCSSEPALSRSSLIERALSERTSDIHLEPQDGEMVVRMRIDGLLRRVLTVPSELQSTVISRLKIMGGMHLFSTPCGKGQVIGVDSFGVRVARDKETAVRIAFQ